MTASPDDRTAAAAEASPLPRRTQRSSAIADAASGAKVRRADNVGGPAGTAGARRAAAVLAASTDASEADSGFAAGFAAGLAFAPIGVTGPDGATSRDAAPGGPGVPAPGIPGAAPGTPPRKRRRGLLACVALAGVLLVAVPLVVISLRGTADGSRDASASATAPGAVVGDADGAVSPPVASQSSNAGSPQASSTSSTSPSASPSASHARATATSASTKKGVAAGGNASVTVTPSTMSTSAAGGVELVSYASGRCIKVSDGGRLQIWDCDGAAKQKWTFKSDGTVRALGKCMDVNGGSRQDTAWIQLVDCNGTGAQQFVLNSSHDLVNTQADKCVDIEDSQTANGTYLQQWTCNGGSNQKWHTG